MIDFRIKSMFFDRSPILKALDRATRSVLSKFGAYVRRGAKSSIRKATKKRRVSIPGSPPLSHTELLRDNIFFGYDSENKSAVIGPVLVGAKGKATTGTVPQAIEKGGEVIIRHGKVTKTATVAARPYMSPAFATVLPKLPAMWKDSVKA